MFAIKVAFVFKTSVVPCQCKLGVLSLCCPSISSQISPHPQLLQNIPSSPAVSGEHNTGGKKAVGTVCELLYSAQNFDSISFSIDKENEAGLKLVLPK